MYISAKIRTCVLVVIDAADTSRTRMITNLYYSCVPYRSLLDKRNLDKRNLAAEEYEEITRERDFVGERTHAAVRRSTVARISHAELWPRSRWSRGSRHN